MPTEVFASAKISASCSPSELVPISFASHSIFSSGYQFAFQETEIMKELAVAHKVPLSAIPLVSSPYHMRRAGWTFRKHAPAIHVTATPVLWSHFYAHSHGASGDQIQGIASEYFRLLYDWWKGWI